MGLLSQEVCFTGFIYTQNVHVIGLLQSILSPNVSPPPITTTPVGCFLFPRVPSGVHLFSLVKVVTQFHCFFSSGWSWKRLHIPASWGGVGGHEGTQALPGGHGRWGETSMRRSILFTLSEGSALALTPALLPQEPVSVQPWAASAWLTRYPAPKKGRICVLLQEGGWGHPWRFSG